MHRTITKNLVAVPVLLLTGLAADAKTTAYVGATLFDGTGADPVVNAVVLVEGERIVGVGKRSDVVLPEGVWSREGLSARDRSLITIASLTALYRPNELKIHIDRGLSAGVTKQEICEIIMHMAIYGGFPVAVEAMRVAKEVFEQA